MQIKTPVVTQYKMDNKKLVRMWINQYSALQYKLQKSLLRSIQKYLSKIHITLIKIIFTAQRFIHKNMHYSTVCNVKKNGNNLNI